MHMIKAIQNKPATVVYRTESACKTPWFNRPSMVKPALQNTNSIINSHGNARSNKSLFRNRIHSLKQKNAPRMPINPHVAATPITAKSNML